MKLELLKNQIRIRNKIMKKNIKIPFSISGISKTSDELYEDAKNMLETEKEQQNGRKRANMTKMLLILLKR